MISSFPLVVMFDRHPGRGSVRRRIRRQSTELVSDDLSADLPPATTRDLSAVRQIRSFLCGSLPAVDGDAEPLPTDRTSDTTPGVEPGLF